MTDTTIERKAQEILARAGVESLPVSLKKIAQYLDLEVEAAILGENVSGVLVVQDGKGSVGYNAQHSDVRQRFTTAHEIGHYILHRENHNLFIDKSYSVVFWRDDNSSSGERLEEIQANKFAAALLMPRNKLQEAIQDMEFDLADEDEGEEAIQILARLFNVSTKAMSYRLLNLEFFS